jgi:ribonuclease HII
MELQHMLQRQCSGLRPEAGVDEAGRGCLAGPVVAAAVILPPDAELPGLTDSKQLGEAERLRLRPLIEAQALAWAVGIVPPQRIDEVNILNATFEAMHEALRGLAMQPAYIAVDGNRFRRFGKIPHQCLIKGDARFLHIAAASVLAKTCRDALMEELDAQWPAYGWRQNKGYPTAAHRAAILRHGPSPLHRMSFRLLAAEQPRLELGE